MLKTLDQLLSETLIKEFHYKQKNGVFEDLAVVIQLENIKIEKTRLEILQRHLMK